MVLKPTPNRGPISSRLSLDFVLPVLPSTGRSRAGAPPTRAPAARTGPGQFWLPPSAAHLHSNGGVLLTLTDPKSFSDAPSYRLAAPGARGVTLPWPVSSPPSPQTSTARGRGAGPALGSGPLFVHPQHSPWALPLASFTSRSPGTHGVRGEPLPFPALSLPHTVPREKERWGGVEPGGVRWVGTGAASSLCPACSLCQSYRDLLGGPGASVGAIKVNLLPPGRVRVVLRLAAWGRPGLSGRASAADPGHRFSPAHREFVFVDVFICQLRGWGQGLLAQGEGPGFRAAARPHKGPSGAGNLDTVRWLLGRDRRREGGARSRPPPRPSPLLP